MALIGCQSGSTVPSVTSAAYRGPAISLVLDGADSVVAMNAPGPGYQIVLDRVSEAYGRRDVFVSVRLPDPRFNYPREAVVQRLGTGIPSRMPTAVFARVLRHDAEANAAGAYSATAGVEGRR